MNEIERENPSNPSQSSHPLQIVSLRTHVEIELVSRSGEAERLEFDIVPDKEADFYSGFLSQDTPMARAILGHPVGTAVPYLAGDSREIRILSVSSSSQADPSGAAAKRKAAVEEAKRQSDRTSAMIYASSVDSKWGDYDADNL